MFERGERKVMKDFNLFRMVQSIAKLKASVSVLSTFHICDSVQSQIEQTYLKMVTISGDHKASVKDPWHDSIMMKFLERDEKTKLYCSHMHETKPKKINFRRNLVKGANEEVFETMIAKISKTKSSNKIIEAKSNIPRNDASVFSEFQLSE